MPKLKTKTESLLTGSLMFSEAQRDETQRAIDRHSALIDVAQIAKHLLEELGDMFEVDVSLPCNLSDLCGEHVCERFGCICNHYQAAYNALAAEGAE